MSAPTTKSHEKLKRLARYLFSCVEVTWYYRWQDDGEMELVVHTDSDWAGCTRTRGSTSGGSIQLGQHTLRTWSTTQRTVAMSSAEAEYNSLIEGVQRTFGVQTMLAELGVMAKIIVYTDSSAAKSFASQRGLGRMRHMEVRKALASGRSSARACSSGQNPRRRQSCGFVDKISWPSTS